MRVPVLMLAAGLMAGCVATSPAPVTPAPSAPAAPALQAIDVGGAPVAIAAGGGLIYCAIEGSDTVTLLDTKDLNASQRFQVPGAAIAHLRAMLDRRQLLALAPATGELLVLDAGITLVAAPVAGPDGVLAPTVAPPPPRPTLLQRLAIGKGVTTFALAEDNLAVLLGADETGSLELLTFAEDRKVAPFRVRLPLGGTPAAGLRSGVDFKFGTWIALDPPGTQLLSGGATPGTPRELAPLGAGGPVAIGTIDGKAAVAIAADAGRDAIVLVDLATGAVTTLAGAGSGPREITIDPDKHRAYVTMGGSDEVAVVDYQARTLLTKLPVGRAPNAISLAAPLPNEVWVTSEDDKLTVIEGLGATPRVKATLPLGKGAHRMTFWGTRGYVSNQSDRTVSVIERVTIR